MPKADVARSAATILVAPSLLPSGARDVHQHSPSEWHSTGAVDVVGEFEVIASRGEEPGNLDPVGIATMAMDAAGLAGSKML